MKVVIYSLGLVHRDTSMAVTARRRKGPRFVASWVGYRVTWVRVSVSASFHRIPRLVGRVG